MRAINLLILSGCVSLATYQTPYTTKEDELSWGLSISGYGAFSDDLVRIPVNIPALYLRYGLSDNTDLGFSFVGFPFFGTTYLDLKNQFIRGENFSGSFSIGTGFWFWPSEIDNIRNLTILQPFFGLSFGNKRIYAGTKIQYFLFSYQEQKYGQYEWSRRSASAFMPSAFLGFTLGKGSFKFVPEFDLMLPLSATDTRGKVVPLSGIIFSYTFGFLYIP
jgi:hypothetical protein